MVAQITAETGKIAAGHHEDREINQAVGIAL